MRMGRRLLLEKAGETLTRILPQQLLAPLLCRVVRHIHLFVLRRLAHVVVLRVLIRGVVLLLIWGPLVVLHHLLLLELIGGVVLVIWRLSVPPSQAIVRIVIIVLIHLLLLR